MKEKFVEKLSVNVIDLSFFLGFRIMAIVWLNDSNVVGLLIVVAGIAVGGIVGSVAQVVTFHQSSLLLTIFLASWS